MMFCVCMPYIKIIPYWLQIYITPETVVLFLCTPTGTPAEGQEESSQEALRGGSLLEASLPASNLWSRGQQVLEREETLNEDCNLNCDYSNSSFMWHKKEVTHWDFLHLGINQAIGTCFFDQVAPIHRVSYEMILPDRWKSFKLLVF